MDEPSLSRVIIDQEPQWLRVKDNVGRALTEAMDARLSTLPGGKDGEAAQAVRKELETRLGKIQDTMFNLAKYNLQVNGQNYEDFVDVTEGWDEVLDRKTKALHIERVDWESKNADKRKKIPEGIYRLEEDLEARRTGGEWLPEDEEEDVGGAAKAEDIPPPPRHEEVKQTFNTVIANLSEVARSAPTQLQRAQRAQTVRDEITNLPP